MVRYPVRAIRALGYLKRRHNDIEIYVEDTTCLNMFLMVFKRVLGPGYNLRSINQIGSRQRVLEACRLDQADDGRKRLYVIDGDMDHITGAAKPRLKHLYRLRAYCVENLLLTEEAVVQLCLVSKPDMAEDDIRQELSFDQWIDDACSMLLGLFTIYAIVQSINVSFPTVQYAVIRLCSSNGTFRELDSSLVFARMRMVVKAAVNQHNLRIYASAARQIRKTSSDCTLPPRMTVSGKDALFPLLHERMKHQFGFRGSIQQLKTYLGSHYEPSTEPYLARRLRGIVAN